MGTISRIGMDKTILIIGVIALVIMIWYFSTRTNARAMVIVEPRKHKMLKYVCENFDKNMTKDWDLYVFHGKSHGDHAREAVSEIRGRKIVLSALESDNLNADGYNILFKDLAFWNQVKAEDILVFQTDAVLCPASKYKIHDFTKYDYIGCGSYAGAIGKSREVWANKYSKNNSFYGVGGLSFRKNSFQKKCIMKYANIDPTYPEDVFYSNCVEESENKPKSATDLANFCTQDTFVRPSFGAHKTWSMREDHMEPFYEFCPAARAIQED
jgi:Protein of unknown function (DUF5672)